MWQDARVRPLVVLLLASACGARPPALIENADQPVGDLRRAGDAYERTAWKRRPQIDVSWLLPDFHDELRWPLSGMHHPKLEPEFPVAQELAIGVDWQGLCARGVHRRISATQKELISYLRGWCHVQERDVDGACAELVPLLGSVKSGLRDAVRRDLANILVESGDAEKAEHWLTKHHVRDIETLDLLAANYVEVGSPADAFAINRRVIDEDDYATPATKCRRLVRRIAIGFDIDVELPVRELESFVVKAKVLDATCERLWNKVACWRDHLKCHAYHVDENIPQASRQLLLVYDTWPSNRQTTSEWWTYADQARLAVPAPGAAELGVGAMEATITAEGMCKPGIAASFRVAIADVRRAPDGAALEPRLQGLENACPATAPPAATAITAPGVTPPTPPSP